MRSNAVGYPVYGVPWTLVAPLLDADGDLVTGASTPDSERSINGDTFADCTNEMVEIATNSGVYYLTLTATEMTADVLTVILKSATAGMKTTVAVLYPRKLVSLRTGTVAANAADGSTLQLDSSASAVDDFYNGCLLVGTLDSNVEARMITDYVGSTKVCTVSPNFVTTPDNNDTFVVYDTEQRQIRGADLAAIGAVAVSTSTAQLGVNTVNAGGTAWASGAITSGVFAADAITAAKLHSDVTTELQNGLATAAALDTVDNFLDTEVAAILAAVDTEVAAIKAVTDLLPDGGALTSLATQASVNTIDDFLDTEIAAIKAKTDNLTFTVAGNADVNIQYVNDVQVVGDGQTGTEWSPA